MSGAVTLGAGYQGGGRCDFRVWAPRAERVDVQIVGPVQRIAGLKRGDDGYHSAVVEDAPPGALYFYSLDGDKRRPDPTSRYQPDGVHGPSAVVDPSFEWSDASWRGLPLEAYVIYELHVGTFTGEGTFDAVGAHLPSLRDLGVTAVEIMPVAQFPGARNWGYDGVHPFAVQNTYGGPAGLKRLVNACHEAGLAVVLDVVYNHLGPEGNYLADFGPYFTERYRTPWGAALNFDGPESDHVRRFFIENALYWVTEFHMDALRLDAVHAIVDNSACPFLQELGVAVHRQAELLGRRIHVIAESDLNAARIVRPPESSGYGHDAQWSDDFHHALHALLTGERGGYYQDFGAVGDLVKAYREGYVYTGQYSAHRRRRHGVPSGDVPASRFVVCAQNHDQVGNRLLGERLSQLVSPEGLKLAAGAVLCSPFVPLLFMGEEYGETAPFRYFVSHTDAALVEAVRRGRAEEFAAFGWRQEPPDPQDEATFLAARLRHDLGDRGRHRLLREYYRELLRLRRELPALSLLSKECLDAVGLEREKVMLVRRWCEGQQVLAILCFADRPVRVRLPVPRGTWRKLLDSSDARWGGSGSSVPAEFFGDGEPETTLNPTALILFLRQEPS